MIRRPPRSPLFPSATLFRFLKVPRVKSVVPLLADFLKVPVLLKANVNDPPAPLLATVAFLCASTAPAWLRIAARPTLRLPVPVQVALPAVVSGRWLSVFVFV